ncbi:helix-turn-helix domain-containing protein [Paremcibacter congregatus]|uniref:helix-turn-helix domain-containing protein n=1 Tax=Paremcibacter congregatus TaxID=2043170 RepID=UPI003A9167B0
MEHNKKTRGKANGVDRAIGLAIGKRRVEMGMSQQELAERIGVTYQQVHKYEAGINRVSSSQLWEIANALKVKAGHFFEQLDTADEEKPTIGALSLIRTYNTLVPAHQAMVRQHAAMLAGGVE